MRCEERTLDDDIRALGGNDAEDERRFAAAANHRSCRRRSASIRLTRAGRACQRAGECPDCGDQRRIREAAVRALIYIAMPRAAVDERAFQAIRRLRARHLDGKGSAVPELTTLSLAEFKPLVREQSFILVFDQKVAVAR